MKTILIKNGSLITIDSLLIGTTITLDVNFNEEFDITYKDLFIVSY